MEQTFEGVCQFSWGPRTDLNRPEVSRRHNCVRGLCYGKQKDMLARLKSGRSGWSWTMNGNTTSLWAAIVSIASKMTALKSLRRWVHQTEIDQGYKAGMSTEQQAKIKALEREIRELKKTNEILRLASAYFAQAEQGRRPKR